MYMTALRPLYTYAMHMHILLSLSASDAPTLASYLRGPQLILSLSSPFIVSPPFSSGSPACTPLLTYRRYSSTCRSTELVQYPQLFLYIPRMLDQSRHSFGKHSQLILRLALTPFYRHCLFLLGFPTPPSQLHRPTRPIFSIRERLVPIPGFPSPCTAQSNPYMAFYRHTWVHDTHAWIAHSNARHS